MISVRPGPNDEYLDLSARDLATVPQWAREAFIKSFAGRAPSAPPFAVGDIVRLKTGTARQVVTACAWRTAPERDAPAEDQGYAEGE